MKPSTLQKLHNAFEFLASGGGSLLIKKPELPPDAIPRRMLQHLVDDNSIEIQSMETRVETIPDPSWEPSIIAPGPVDTGLRTLTVVYKKK